MEKHQQDSNALAWKIHLKVKVFFLFLTLYCKRIKSIFTAFYVNLVRTLSAMIKLAVRFVKGQSFSCLPLPRLYYHCVADVKGVKSFSWSLQCKEFTTLNATVTATVWLRWLRYDSLQRLIGATEHDSKCSTYARPVGGTICSPLSH